MSLPYDNKPTTKHEEFAMDVLDAQAEEVAPYEPGGAEEKVCNNEHRAAFRIRVATDMSCNRHSCASSTDG